MVSRGLLSREIDTPSHGLLDASTGVEVRDALQVRLILNKILDEDYPSSAEADTVPAPRAHRHPGPRRTF